MRKGYIRTGFKTGSGLRKGGVVRPSIKKSIFSGIGVRKSEKSAGKIYKKYK